MATVMRKISNKLSRAFSNSEQRPTKRVPRSPLLYADDSIDDDESKGVSVDTCFTLIRLVNTSDQFSKVILRFENDPACF